MGDSLSELTATAGASQLFKDWCQQQEERARACSSNCLGCHQGTKGKAAEQVPLNMAPRGKGRHVPFETGRKLEDEELLQVLVTSVSGLPSLLPFPSWWEACDTHLPLGSTRDL